ncbi:MAG: GFA family protein [Methylocella sp.]
MTQITQLACACGQVHIEAEGAPIVNAECHCNSCRAAGARLQTLPAALPFLETNGGTRFVLYRKDRIRFLKGAELLKEFRLKPTAKTRRVVATCCNTPVFLEFLNGHWLSLYGCLWPEGTLPPLDLRTMTSDLPDFPALADDVPNAKRQSVSFFAKLLGAWIAMGFKIPKITVVNGEIHV